MRPPVTTPFTLFCEEHVQELVSQLNGQAVQAWGRAIPLSTFVNDVWQSAKREGYVEGYVECQIDQFGRERSEEPPTSIVGDWRKRAGKKATGG